MHIVINFACDNDMTVGLLLTPLLLSFELSFVIHL